MSVNGLSTLPRLTSLGEPAGPVGWTLTAPQPVAASAARATGRARQRAVRSFSEGMRPTKVEDHSRVLIYGAIGGPLPKLGVIAAAVLAAVVMLQRDARVQALAMLGALVLAPVLLLADIWHSPQLGIVHRHPLEALVAAAIALAVVIAGA